MTARIVHDCDVETGPLYAVVDGETRLGEIYRNHAGEWIGAYLVKCDDGLEQVEHPMSFPIYHDALVVVAALSEVER